MIRTIALALCSMGLVLASAARAADTPAPAMQAVLDCVKGQKTTGFLVIQDRKTVVERNWPAPADAAPAFKAMALYGNSPDGALLEDVASQQKSFVSMLAAIAVDKGLLDIAQPVSRYVGAGWSKASPEQEAKIRVIDVLTMSSGLNENFTYAAPPGTAFFYNTPVYAVTKRVLEAAAHLPLDILTRDWLTAPLGMTNTAWRARPASMASVGNPTGLVTNPRDEARFGQMVLDGGVAADGRRVVSEAGLKAMMVPTKTNPAYGRLWWLNGSAYSIRPLARRVDGPMIPAAPKDLVAAEGALDRKLYVVPSLKLVVVRLGDAAPEKDFEQQLWLRLMKALP